MLQQEPPATQVTVSDLDKIKSALEDPAYVWRTTQGLSKDTDLPEDTIAAGLNQLPSDVLVATRGKQGRLFTTRKHYYEKQSFLGRVLTAATGRFK